MEQLTLLKCIMRTLVCVREVSSPWTLRSGPARTRDFKLSVFLPSVFYFCFPECVETWFFSLTKLATSFVGSGAKQKLRASCLKSRENMFSLFPWSFLWTCNGFYLLFNFPLSRAQGHLQGKWDPHPLWALWLSAWDVHASQHSPHGEQGQRRMGHPGIYSRDAGRWQAALSPDP